MRTIRTEPLRLVLIAGLTLASVASFMSTARAQSKHRASTRSICGNPKLPCKTIITFEPYDLSFRVPQGAVIYDTELFYAIILKSVGNSDTDCEAFVPESERQETQALFPDHKVFSSRCPEGGMLFYSNISSNHRIMALYAGSTLVEAQRLLATVKATGKFPGAYIRRMRIGFNGT